MVKIFLKISFAFFLVFFLLKSGRLDLSLIGQLFKVSNYWMLGALIFPLIPLITSLRWILLVNQDSTKKFPYIVGLKLTWIGLFFNNFLPGAVTGDLIKLGYAKSINSTLSKTHLFTVMFADRVFGVMGLLFVMGFFTIIQFHDLIAISPLVSKFVYFNLSLFLGVIVFFAFLFLPFKGQTFLKCYLKKVPIVGEMFGRLLTQVWNIGKSKSTVLKVISLSILVQFLGILAFWFLIFPFILETSLSFYSFMTLAPMGFMAIAIPISPSGLGVGHVAFEFLFESYGVEKGASLFNLFFLFQVAVNALGAIPYFRVPKKMI